MKFHRKSFNKGFLLWFHYFFFLLSSLLIGTKDSLVGGEVKRSSNSSTNLWTTSFTELTGQIHFRGSPSGNFFFTDLVINFITKLVLISFLIRRLRSTMWKFCNFSATLILREINFDWFQKQTQFAVGYVVTRFLEKMPKYSCNWQFGYKNFKISGNHIAHHSVVTPKKQILG